MTSVEAVAGEAGWGGAVSDSGRAGVTPTSLEAETEGPS